MAWRMDGGWSGVYVLSYVLCLVLDAFIGVGGGLATYIALPQSGFPARGVWASFGRPLARLWTRLGLDRGEFLLLGHCADGFSVRHSLSCCTRHVVLNNTTPYDLKKKKKKNETVVPGSVTPIFLTF